MLELPTRDEAVAAAEKTEWGVIYWAPKREMFVVPEDQADVRLLADEADGAGLYAVEAQAGSLLAATVFGSLLVDLMESRGIPVTPEIIGGMAQRSGLKAGKLVGRMQTEGVDVGPLSGLARELDLSESEMMDLALAYAFEMRS